VQLLDIHADAEAQVQHTIEARKEQHKRWNQSWLDATWRPITPPLDSPEDPPNWAPLLFAEASYPTPPPTLPSDSPTRDEDVEMTDQPPIKEDDAATGATPEPDFIFHIPGAYPTDNEPSLQLKREAAPACRLRYGRGGRCFLEARRKRSFGQISTGVVSDSDSDDEGEDYYPIDSQKIFDYRCATNFRGSRPESMPGHRHSASGDQAAMVGAAQAPAELRRGSSGGAAA
jgi:enhancer of polycomb-like protein